jgi:hypothetical protein
MAPHDAEWAAVCRHIEQRGCPKHFSAWFSNIEIANAVSESLTLSVLNNVHILPLVATRPSPPHTTREDKEWSSCGDKAWLFCG